MLNLFILTLNAPESTVSYSKAITVPCLNKL